MFEFLGEVIRFVRKRKKLWMAPMVICMALLAVLLAFVQGSAMAPFIYTLF